MTVDDYLAAEDQALLGQCDVHIYKSSGPGGQHRNKVSSAVRLRHVATGVSAHGDDSRSQHTNKRMALRRLRMNMACRLRSPCDTTKEPPAFVGECIFTARGGPAKGRKRMEIGTGDHRFWRVGAWLLDLLDAASGSLADAAAVAGITTSNLVRVLRSHRKLQAAAGDIRRRHGLQPIQ